MRDWVPHLPHFWVCLVPTLQEPSLAQELQLLQRQDDEQLRDCLPQLPQLWLWVALGVVQVP